jgi:hypothetical protein
MDCSAAAAKRGTKTSGDRIVPAPAPFRVQSVLVGLSFRAAKGESFQGVFLPPFERLSAGINYMVMFQSKIVLATTWKFSGRCCDFQSLGASLAGLRMGYGNF